MELLEFGCIHKLLQGEYGFSTLVTIVLPPESECFPKEDLVPLILKQNGLEGQHSVPRFKDKPKGVQILTMGVAPEMVEPIRALGGRGVLGMMAVKINVKKDDEKDKSEDKKDKDTLSPAISSFGASLHVLKYFPEST